MLGEFANVKLTLEEDIKLRNRFGDSVTEDYIERLSCWLKNTRKKRPSHYATLLTWIRKDGTITAKIRPFQPLIEEAELRSRAEVMHKVSQRDLDYWIKDKAKHDCGCEYACRYEEARRPLVPSVEEFVKRIKGK